MRGNYTTLKNYSGISYKLTKCYFDPLQDKKVSEKGSVNDHKLEGNISRARNAIFEYAICNPWDYFLTLTLAPENDRYDLSKFITRLGQWLRNYGKRHDVDLKYLLVPEQHKDGAWHMHGFLMGLPADHLTDFSAYKGKRKLPKYINDKIKKGSLIYNWEDYEKKFGFCDLEPIRSHEAAAKYVTKYISKSLYESAISVNSKLYYVSRGLNRAEVMKKGVIPNSEKMGTTPNFFNAYCEIYQTRSVDQAATWADKIITL